jgi:hypothetical protein
MTHNDDFNDVDEFRFPESLADEYMDKSEFGVEFQWVTGYDMSVH